MEKIRVQKIVSDSGFCSRRKAEQLISEGKVTVNGRAISLGDKADPKNDLICVDGQRLETRAAAKKEYRYIMLNKPRGYVTTMKDELDRKCVTALLGGVNERVYPVGRLDKNSEGLLLFTNDGGFANGMTHPSHKINKTYRVTVRAQIDDERLVKLSEGVMIDGKMTQPCRVTVLSRESERSVLQFIITEGRNRQIRKMCEAVGLEVKRLKRTSIGTLKLGMLKPGGWRDLKPDEIRSLKKLI